MPGLPIVILAPKDFQWDQIPGWNEKIGSAKIYHDENNVPANVFLVRLCTNEVPKRGKLMHDLGRDTSFSGICYKLAIAPINPECLQDKEKQLRILAAIEVMVKYYRTIRNRMCASSAPKNSQGKRLNKRQRLARKEQASAAA